MSLAAPVPVVILGDSPAMRRAMALADRFAPTRLPILLIGATGTGKELFARRIHARSERSGPLVPVNCAALPREMVESLLFGHRRGAFTGAVTDCAGFIEAAQRGTLYLDELSSLPLEAQAKLLRVLESKEVYRLGETTPRPVDFRLLTSSQEDLPARVRDGRFRLDLLERAAGVRIALAPLRERAEDIVPLAQHFAQLQGQVLAPGASGMLPEYNWPGNVRELRAVVERAGVLSPNGTIEAASIAEAMALGAVPSNGNGEGLTSSGRDAQAALVKLCVAHGCDARRIGWRPAGGSRRSIGVYGQPGCRYANSEILSFSQAFSTKSENSHSPAMAFDRNPLTHRRLAR